jgi:hypothetical protein
MLLMLQTLSKLASGYWIAETLPTLSSTRPLRRQVTIARAGLRDHRWRRVYAYD